MPDFALVLAESVTDHVGDMAIVDDDVLTDGGLLTALQLSLYTDRLAEPDDVIPDGTGDRRGWWGDGQLPDDADRFGSRLWLLSRVTAQQDNAVRARLYIEEATAWLLEDRIVDSLDIEVEQLEGGNLCYVVTAVRPDQTSTEFRFPHVWDQVYGV